MWCKWWKWRTICPGEHFPQISACCYLLVFPCIICCRHPPLPFPCIIYCFGMVSIKTVLLMQFQSALLSSFLGLFRNLEHVTHGLVTQPIHVLTNKVGGLCIYMCRIIFLKWHLSTQKRHIWNLWASEVMQCGKRCSGILMLLPFP